jgi:hypothetical protein
MPSKSSLEKARKGLSVSGILDGESPPLTSAGTGGQRSVNAISGLEQCAERNSIFN